MEDSSSLASVPTPLTLSTCAVNVETADDRVVVHIAGELDMADADQVGDVILGAVGAGKATVRIELSELRFADSSAIKAILIGAQAADDRGIAYELVNPRGLVLRLLEVTGLNGALTVVQDADKPGQSQLGISVVGLDTKPCGDDQVIAEVLDRHLFRQGIDDRQPATAQRDLLQRHVTCRPPQLARRRQCVVGSIANRDRRPCVVQTNDLQVIGRSCRVLDRVGAQLADDQRSTLLCFLVCSERGKPLHDFSSCRVKGAQVSVVPATQCSRGIGHQSTSISRSVALFCEVFLDHQRGAAVDDDDVAGDVRAPDQAHHGVRAVVRGGRTMHRRGRRDRRMLVFPLRRPWRRDQPRSDGIDADRAARLGEQRCHVVERGLRHRVRDRRADRSESGNRRDGDDVPDRRDRANGASLPS